jgi:hypothetical protein
MLLASGSRFSDSCPDLIRSLNVRFGSKADMTIPYYEVRFSAMSGRALGCYFPQWGHRGIATSSVGNGRREP